MPEESSSNECLMNLPARGEMNACKSPIKGKTQRREMHLGQMHVDLLAPMNTRNGSTINNRQIQLRSQHAVYATFSCTGVNQRPYSSHSRHWYLRWRSCAICGIETDINQDCRPVSHEQDCARNASRHVVEAAFRFSHGLVETSRMQAASGRRLQLGGSGKAPGQSDLLRPALPPRMSHTHQ
ncbi:MAG: hypothetical protein JWQ04_2573 [Pedosphaera sp.]|nr:hypothetical protein [Pedosphaera sp.]